VIATISKTFTFDAAHRLDRLPPEHKCHRMHGHTYRVELILSGHVADNGFLLDYADIAEMWAPLHELLDHRILNEVPGLDVPTTENLAGWILSRIGWDGHLSFTVRVFESSTTWCEMKYCDITLAEARYFRTGELAR